MLYLQHQEPTNQTIMKRFITMAILMSAFWVANAQRFTQMLNEETAKAHLENRKRKIETRNIPQLISAFQSEMWTDGKNYYSGGEDGNKYLLFPSSNTYDSEPTASFEFQAKGLSFQNLTEKGTTVRYQVAGIWKMLVFYDKGGKPFRLMYAITDSPYIFGNPPLDYQTVINGVYSLKECNGEISEKYLKQTHFTKMVFGENWYIPKAENYSDDYRGNDPGPYALQSEPNHLLMGFGRHKRVPLPPIPKLEIRVIDGEKQYFANGERISAEQYKEFEHIMAPGYGGNAAEGEPARWDVEFTTDGLSVHATPTKYILYEPDFGTEFSLTKDCSSYGFDIPGRWAYASVRPLTRYMLSLLPKEVLVLMRGEIYARHGDTFKNPETQKYFDAQPWYKKSNKPVVLTDIERLNVALIKAEESERP